MNREEILQTAKSLGVDATRESTVIDFAESLIRQERDRCADMVPTNWLDPLLTGSSKVLPSTQPYRGPDIERLLVAIRDRIATANAEAHGQERSAAK